MGDFKQPYAFLFTIRGKLGVTDAQIDRFKSWWPQSFDYGFAVLEKEGKERHLHAVLFPRIQQQRSNVVKQCLTHVLHDFDADEVRNFKFVPKKGPPTCVKHAYSTSVITDYLSGGLKEKAGDPFSIIIDVLPDDLSEIEPYFRDNYERDKSMWYKSLLRNFQKHLGWPRHRPVDFKMHWTAVLQSIYYLENKFIIDARVQNPAVTTWRAKKFTQIYNDSHFHHPMGLEGEWDGNSDITFSHLQQNLWSRGPNDTPAQAANVVSQEKNSNV